MKPKNIEEQDGEFISLTNKKTGKKRKYRLFKEEQLPFLNDNHNKNIIKFNIDDLEKEYDYETDED